MPDRPEVETWRHLLALRLTGAHVRDAAFPAPGIFHGLEPAAFAAAVTGKCIGGVGRRGKYLCFHLQDPAPDAPQSHAALERVVHLKMRGSLRVEPAGAPPEPYLCAALLLNGDRTLRFYDMRRWGQWTRRPAGTALANLPGLSTLGPEPLEAAFTSAYLIYLLPVLFAGARHNPLPQCQPDADATPVE